MSNPTPRRRTLADYFEETKLQVSGGPDLMAGRRRRMAELVIDGRPLGEYELDVPRDKEASKRFVEIQWLAIVLVGCDVDREIREIRSLPAGNSATPDFEAANHDGSTVRIELTRVVDEDEKRYMAALGGIATQAQKLLEAQSVDHLTGGGEFFLRFYGIPAPTPADMAKGSRELIHFIVQDRRLRQTSTTLWPAGPQYPTLERLGAHVCHSNNDGPTHITIDPSLERASRNAVVASFGPVVAQKKAKVSSYSGGHPVWLALFVDTRLFYPIGVVQSLSDVDSFDPRPFTRVLVGCPTAGVVFEQPNVLPRYTSLSTSG